MSKFLKNNFIFYIILFLSTALLQLKFYNFNNNHFDTGIEIHDTYRVFSGDINHLFSGHIKLIKIFFLPVFYFDNILIISFFFFFIKTACVLSPLYFFKKIKIKILYIINPITWNFLLGDFVYDYLLIPLFFFTFHHSKKNINYQFLSLSFLFIKETFFIFPFILGLINYFRLKDKKWIFLTLLALILKILFFNKIYLEGKSGGVMSFLPNTTIASHVDYSILIFFILLAVNYIIIFPNFKNRFSIVCSVILLIIYLFFSFYNQRLSIFSHYHLPFFLILFTFYCKKKINYFFKYKIATLILFNFLFSISFISLSFWKTDPVKTYSRISYIKNFNQERIHYINFREKKIAISNSFLLPETILSKKLISFAPDINLYDLDYVIISKKYISYGDKICFKKEECSFLMDYEKAISNMLQSFIKIKEYRNYTIYQKKLDYKVH